MYILLYMKNLFYFFSVTIALLIAHPLPLTGQDFSNVPGTVVDHQPVPYYGTGYPAIYISDPEILVLSNGNYVMSHALAGWASGSDTSGKTSVFCSTNKGVAWSQISTIDGFLRGSLIEHNGALYLIGNTNDTDGGAVICKSLDSGSTWIKSSTFTGGALGTPQNPVIFSNRIWCAGGTTTFSAPVDADWLQESSWLIGNGFPGASTNWIVGKSIVTEGQILTSPEIGLAILPKVGMYPYAALSRIDPQSGGVTFDPNHDFVALPGGEKKFGAAYDPVSGKFFVLSNPILPVDKDSGQDPNMIRNTAAVLTSRDLYNWSVEKIILYSTDPDRDGFCYMNFDFDGSDMVIASRTAFPVGSDNDPQRAHDSNLLTFHRLADVRNLSPDHILTISGNQILRYERTGYQNAPLGSFTLGTNFAGAALSSPDSLGQDLNGTVYVHETGGRTLCFDAAGNFLRTTNAAPVSLQASSLSVIQPESGRNSWIGSGSGNWSDPLNWYYWGRPDTSDEIAVFGSAANGPATITLPSISREWLFNSAAEANYWKFSAATNITVTNGILQMTPTSTTPYLYQDNQSFYGNSISNISVRMRANTASQNIVLRWKTTTTASFNPALSVTNTYTGNGEFQDIVLSPAGHPQWNGQLIDSIQFYIPGGGSLPLIEIDSITVQKEPNRLKGMIFRNANSYTVSGTGSLALGSDSSTGLLEVQQGSHEIQIPVALSNDTSFTAAEFASLTISTNFDLNGRTLSLTGSGSLLIKDSPFAMGGGTLQVGSTVTFSNLMAEFDGTVEFKAAEDFVPAAGKTCHILEGSLYGDMFTNVVLPALPEGLIWDTSTLYSNGNITVICRIPADWMAGYNLSTNGSADFIDSDGDGMDNYAEWKAGTNPTNDLSFFRIDRQPATVSNGFKLRWNSLSNRTYRLDGSTNLLDSPAFRTIRSGIQGAAGVTEIIDTNAANQRATFYRIIIE